MKRRDFIPLIGGATIGWQLPSRAQPLPIPVIGFLALGLRQLYAGDPAAFRKALAEEGYIEGQNVLIEYRFAGGLPEQLPGLAKELVNRNVTVIFATGSLATVRAVKAATLTIPIIFALGGDPVKYGLVASLSRPGGNVTGVTVSTLELSEKRLELLCEAVPQVKTIAYLSGGPSFVAFKDESSRILAAAQALGRKIVFLEAPTNREIEAAFAKLLQLQADALIVGVNPHLASAYKEIVRLAALHKIPGVYPSSAWCRGGGLMSYSSDTRALYRQIASQYLGRILKGAKPADLPVQEPTKFELVINLNIATSIGVTVPPALLTRADELIE